MSSFIYKYLAVKSIFKGRKTSFYLLRTIRFIHRFLPILLKLIDASFRFLYSSYTTSWIVIDFNVQAWLRLINHLVVFYQAVYTSKLMLEYLNINIHKTNRFLKVIYVLIEPYYRMVNIIFSSDVIGNTIGFFLISIIAYVFETLLLTIGIYYNRSTGLNDMNLLLKASFDEKIVFN